ncbi:MAG: phosphoribosylformylglycinamidine cyclo-ligase [Clostridiales Family XIII bacterium]|jgi:phosphoribosylformylglycinamidine cyclo-ligase|nr:phosphoribosylformylglycinamidine cyclo-ligase [Clostridiales Family XIII bacterium]
MPTKITYKDAGVDTIEGQRAVSLMKDHVKKTFGPEVLTGLGSFGSLFQPDLSGMKTPVLVAGTDGVGTKLKIAILMDRHDTVGQDLVAMCVNDVLCQGARPLFFLDYIATGHVSAEKVAELVKGVADGCELAGCALVGGETAEMPGFYAEDDYDMAGFCVGIVDRDSVIDGSRVAEGDLLIGVPSSGIHSNGYSLVRKLFFENLGIGVHDTVDGLDGPLGEALLTPTRIYTKEVMSVLPAASPHAIVHITGGGFYENIPRVLPEGLGVQINLGTWEVPPIFNIIQSLGGMGSEDIYSTLNMGIGLIFVVAERDRAAVLNALEAAGENGAAVIGKVVKGEGVKLNPAKAKTDKLGNLVTAAVELLPL